ncbi:hypothetical protein NC652_018948 [Populus alba x Populus x berolinensis]|nr:hypothetical protein NC652_018948 [Populus alba x Populus x berolinensis]
MEKWQPESVLMRRERRRGLGFGVAGSMRKIPSFPTCHPARKCLPSLWAPRDASFHRVVFSIRSHNIYKGLRSNLLVNFVTFPSLLLVSSSDLHH